MKDIQHARVTEEQARGVERRAWGAVLHPRVHRGTPIPLDEQALAARWFALLTTQGGEVCRDGIAASAA